MQERELQSPLPWLVGNARGEAIPHLHAFYTLLTYVFGFVIRELPRVHQQPPSAYAAAWDEVLDRLDVASYPTLRDLRPHLITAAASSEQFDYWLRRVVDSLEPPG